MTGHLRFAPPSHLTTREAIEGEIERLLSALDDMDDDPDFEPSLGSSHEESQTGWGQGSGDDREPDGDEEDYIGNDDETQGLWPLTDWDREHVRSTTDGLLMRAGLIAEARYGDPGT